ncbi:neurofilament medium polypeptide-like [Palaemon carinicauda]|uniref:neurofilament medium polypeptide-like n=1 Tax=Palaemon carinicauda TaxID=392227 RepID=UPI0035B5F01F
MHSMAVLKAFGVCVLVGVMGALYGGGLHLKNTAASAIQARKVACEIPIKELGGQLRTLHESFVYRWFSRFLPEAPRFQEDCVVAAASEDSFLGRWMRRCPIIGGVLRAADEVERCELRLMEMQKEAERFNEQLKSNWLLRKLLPEFQFGRREEVIPVANTNHSIYIGAAFAVSVMAGGIFWAVTRKSTEESKQDDEEEIENVEREEDGDCSNETEEENELVKEVLDESSVEAAGDELGSLEEEEHEDEEEGEKSSDLLCDQDNLSEETELGDGCEKSSPDCEEEEIVVTEVLEKDNTKVQDLEASDVPTESENFEILAEREETAVPTGSENSEVLAEREETDVPTGSDNSEVLAEREETDVPTGSENSEVLAEREETAVPTGSENSEVLAEREETAVPTGSENSEVLAEREETAVPTGSENSEVLAEREETAVPTGSENSEVLAEREETDVPTRNENSEALAEREESDVPTGSENSEFFAERKETEAHDEWEEGSNIEQPVHEDSQETCEYSEYGFDKEDPAEEEEKEEDPEDEYYDEDYDEQYDEDYFYEQSLLRGSGVNWD